MEYKVGQILTEEEQIEFANWHGTVKTNLITEQQEDGTIVVVEDKEETPVYTKEELREKRRFAYFMEKDPITCTIQSLRDEEQTEEVIAEINELIAERAEVVKKIKERYPYPDEDNNSI